MYAQVRGLRHPRPLGSIARVKPSQIPPGGRELRTDEYASLVEELTEIVNRSHLFKSLDDEGRQRVLESGYVATFAAGDTLMRQDEEGSTMYLVLKGKIRIEAEGPSGKVHLAELGRDACVGEVSVLTSGPRTATVTAVADVDAVAFERHRIQRVLDGYPKVRALLESLVESRAKQTIEKLVGGDSDEA